MAKYRLIMDYYEVNIDFESEEAAYNYAVNHIHTMKMMCGDIYIPYTIKEVK